MPSYKSLAQKLQTALCVCGVPVVIEEKRFYSIKYKRFITKYEVYRKEPGQRKEILAETYSIIDVIKKLAELYATTGGVNNGS